MEALVYQLQGNEFRLTPYKVKKTNICDALAADVYLWPSIVAQSDLPKTCPFLKVS